MKKILTIVCLVGVASLTMTKAFAYAIIADWTFETSVPVVTGNNAGPYTPEAGVNAASSSASGHHATATTAYSSPAGNGSPHSFSANNWLSGDYYQFHTSTLGYSDGLSVTFSAMGSATGPANFKIAYSTDGVNFTDFSPYSLVSAPSWSTTTPNNTSTENFAFDFSTITALNNQSDIYFRLIDTSPTAGGAINGGTVGTAGTSRVDNFEIIDVPEPATWGAISGLGLLGICGLRTWRERRSASLVA